MKSILKGLGLSFLLAAQAVAAPAPIPVPSSAPAAVPPAASSTSVSLPDVPLPTKEVVASPDAGLIGQLVGRLLEQEHYEHRPIDAAISGQALHNYFDSLDYDHFIFNQGDIDRFKSLYGDAFEDRLTQRADVAPAYDIYAKFVERLRERVAEVDKLLDKGFDFKKDETVQLDRHKAAWPATEADARDLWRRQIKAEVLQEKLDKAKPEEQLKTVRQRYERLLRSVLEYDSSDVLELYLNGLAHAYDPHSDYLAASQKANFDISMRLSLVGIGAVLRSEDGYAKIVSLVPGGPADMDKRLKPSDRIEAVAQGDGAFEEVVGMKLDKVVSLIRGEKGTKVRLRIIPADAISRSTRVVVSIIRDEIHLTEQEAKAKIIDWPVHGRTIKLGVVDLPSFYSGEGKSTTHDVAKLIDYLTRQGVQGIVMDLRRNGGGALQEAVSLTGLFIGERPVVQVKDSAGAIKVLSASEEEQGYDGPLLVLTSRMSASASEIFAGAMQDYGRAVIVGEKSTFGKGTVQSVLNLIEAMPPSYHGENPGALKLTVQKFYRVSGASTQNRGVIPDVRLPSIEDVLDVTESSLDDALPYDEVPAAVALRQGPVTTALPRLRADSAARVAANPEFGYIRQDMARVEKEKKTDNTVSLDEAKRLAQLEEERARDELRKKERAARKAPEPKSTDVTLESIDGKPLPKPAATAPEEPEVAQSTGTKGDSYEKAPPESDAAFDESLRVLADLIEPSNDATPSASANRRDRAPQ